MDAEVVIDLRDKMINAIQNSYIIGVRNDIVNINFGTEKLSLPDADFLSEFRENLKLREVEKNLNYHSLRRIASLHKFLTDFSFQEHVKFCSAWINCDFHSSRVIFDLLEQQEKFGLISCRSVKGASRGNLAIN